MNYPGTTKATQAGTNLTTTFNVHCEPAALRGPGDWQNNIKEKHYSGTPYNPKQSFRVYFITLGILSRGII